MPTGQAYGTGSTATARYASGEVGDGGVHSGLLVRAGMAAVPYLVRQEQWTVSAGMLERAFNEDPSRSNAAAMLPAVQQMASHDPTLASATSARPSVPSPISRMHAATATPRFRCNATRCATPTWPGT